MNRIAQSIKNRLSLRNPQTESLEILSILCDELNLKKNSNLAEELEKVKSRYPTCADFERDFTSICFALATGVGKTRLMGAFISYLYLAKGIKNFFVLAPNLTIYSKLMTDFSEPNHPKYVFQGIGEFVTKRPQIVTGENYQYVGSTLTGSDLVINVFNISKINSETRVGQSPRIKRLSEYLGESYFNYLSNLEDLVLLMDESHHYRADRGMQVINELNPILGLELTATPQIERAGGPIKFKNVVYEYSLAKAIKDGFVKEPAVATRKDFDPSKYSPEDLDHIKLEDGLRIHEDTKVALDIYARDNRVYPVKPFVLVVAKDTNHAGKLMALIKSKAFFDGRYAEKVMEIHSNQRGGEKEENIQQLISLENPDNKIEIVIHVNMLKEGWDVTNLYTIIPLRTAASLTLREQTIGRGLRLPYGKRTEVSKVDTLTIVAHDKFQAIIDAANLPDSIIRKENIIEINPEDLKQEKEVVVSVSNFEQKIQQEQAGIEQLPESESKEKAKINLEAQKIILDLLPEMGRGEVESIHDLKNSEVKKIVVEKIKQRLHNAPQGELFINDTVKEAEAAYGSVVDGFVADIIEIPRVTVQPSPKVKSGFKDFDLDVRNLNFQPVSEEILRQTLREQERDIISDKGIGGIDPGQPEKMIVNELMNFPEVDYDEQAELLFKLVGQAIEKFSSYLDSDKMENVVQYHKREIGRYIYAQLMEYFEYSQPNFETAEVLPFTRIEQHNYEKLTKDKIYHYTDTIEPTNAIPGKLFSGFNKACHRFYKYRSKTEKDFSVILEKDDDVLKWLKPAPNQFNIYWEHNSRRYEPDFVVETNDSICLIETKRESDMDSREVELKAKAAFEFCQRINEYIFQNSGKQWQYVLIPHNAVLLNMSLENLVQQYEYKAEDEQVALASEGKEIKKSDLFYSDIIPDEEKYVKALPVYSLEAVATTFGKEESVEELGWMKVNIGKSLNKDMFIAQVIGKSMEPTISDKSWCVFKSNPTGSRNGKVVLVESRQIIDPESYGKYTIKRYVSEKEYSEDGAWKHKKIVLSPDNKEFDDIVLEKVLEGDFHVVAEFVEVIKGK